MTAPEGVPEPRLLIAELFDKHFAPQWCPECATGYGWHQAYCSVVRAEVERDRQREAKR